MSKIEVLVGMIASGKSTYARKRADEGALVVSLDGLTSMLHARYRYDDTLKSCYRDSEEDIVYNALAYGRDAVIDDTNSTREQRARWIRVGRNLDCPVVATTFPTRDNERHALARTLADPRGHSFDTWKKVADRHSENFAREPLDVAEGFDSIQRIT